VRSHLSVNENRDLVRPRQDRNPMKVARFGFEHVRKSLFCDPGWFQNEGVEQRRCHAAEAVSGIPVHRPNTERGVPKVASGFSDQLGCGPVRAR
jgi:hypothetical protein